MADIGSEGLGLKMSAHGLRRSPPAVYNGAPTPQNRLAEGNAYIQPVLRQRPHTLSATRISVQYSPFEMSDLMMALGDKDSGLRMSYLLHSSVIRYFSGGQKHAIPCDFFTIKVIVHAFLMR